MSAPLFEARGLHKRFGDQVVLQGVDLHVDEGELLGIMGPNGAGKTTCFNVLTGRHPPDGGRVRFAGEDITGRSPRQVARCGIARSFQLMNLFDDETALDNVLLATPEVRAQGFSMWRDLRRDAVAHAHAAEVLAQVGLAAQADVPATRLSYGERRALEIGVALAGRPRLLFLDEPTAGLGRDGTARLVELVRSLKRRLTLVVIEHDMPFLFALADRICVIHWGQVIAQGTPAELRANPWVARSNLGAPA